MAFTPQVPPQTTIERVAIWLSVLGVALFITAVPVIAVLHYFHILGRSTATLLGAAVFSATWLCVLAWMALRMVGRRQRRLEAYRRLQD